MSNRFDVLVRDAQSVSRGEKSPAFTKRVYEDCMLDIAKVEAAPGETPAACFARLASSGDPRLGALYQASLSAARDVDTSARADLLAKAKPAHGSRAHVYSLMIDSATLRKRDSETVAQALDRLLKTDENMRDAYALYCEAPQ